jgi:hypothetical protein
VFERGHNCHVLSWNQRECECESGVKEFAVAHTHADFLYGSAVDEAEYVFYGFAFLL